MNTVEESTQLENKSISQLSKFRHSDKAQKIITELNSMYGNTKEKVFELIETLRQDGLKDKDIKKVLLTEVHFMSRASLYNALPDNMKRRYESKPLSESRNITTDLPYPEPEPEPEPLPHIEYVTPDEPRYEAPKPIDTSYTVKTRLIVRTPDKGDYAAEVIINCYPDSKTAEVEPIYKKGILPVTTTS